MAGATFVREVRTEARFTLADLGPFPALREGGGTAVRGELYEVTAEQLAALDCFEGVPHLYERVTVRLEDGAHAQAYVQRGTSIAPATSSSRATRRAHRKERSRACETP